MYNISDVCIIFRMFVLYLGCLSYMSIHLSYILVYLSYILVYLSLVQAESGLGVFRLVGPEEQIKGLLSLCPGIGLPDHLQRLFRLRLNRIWQTVQYVHGLVHAAALLTGVGIGSLRRRPKPMAPSPIANSGTFIPLSFSFSSTSHQLWVDFHTPSSIARNRLSPRSLTPMTTRAHSFVCSALKPL